MRRKIGWLMSHPLFSGSAVMVGGGMVVNVLNYVYHLIMGRMLGPEDYGVLASIFSILYIVGVVPSSASVAVVKFIASAKNEEEMVIIYRKLRKLVFYISVFLAVVMVGVSPMVARFLHISNVYLLVMVGPILFFTFMTLVNQATLQGLLKFWGHAGPSIVMSVTRLAVGVLLVVVGWSVFGAMVGLCLGVFLAFVYSKKLSGFLEKVESEADFDMRPFFKYTAPVLFQALAFTSLFTTDVLLVKHFLSPLEAGLYAALSTLGKIIFFAASPVISVMFPIVSRRESRGEDYRKVLLLAIGLVAMIGLGVVGIYYLFPVLAIKVLYGEAYLGVKSYLVWVGVFMAIYTMASLLVNFFLSVGKVRVVILPLVAAVLQVVGIVLWHGSIFEVILVSLVVSGVMFVGLAGMLGQRLAKTGALKWRKDEKK